MEGTTDVRAVRPNEESELFQAAELERIGLLPVEDDGRAGKLFVGDGTRAEGWYRAWPGEGLTVVTCDFTILQDTLFAIDTCRYLTVRGPAPGAEGRTAMTSPVAIAYIETREGWVTTPVPAGSHFAYTEVEYFEGALRDAFSGLGWGSIGGVSSLLAEMGGNVGWAPGVLFALDELARADPAAPGTSLVYEGAAKVLLGALVGTAAAALPGERGDRAGILAAVELANARWREGASQEEAADVAGMGLTKFKRLFRQVAGQPWGAYLVTRRMREAKVLLAGDATVEHVAHAVGYRSSTSFSAAFVRACGMTPGDYRRSVALSVERVDDSSG
ncbi:helix-turn-helix domain-containing protein [Thermophilibacter mediterraneus]|uniref:helix-turn-helix domain-containing protein n=1 Tax=Thermophilibacter mediterraneus TaxID=1871031 RepID=UPI00320BA5B3